MASLPYMQFYFADYMADTAHLNVLQHGAYFLLIVNYWQTGKPLPNCDKKLANICKMTPLQWQRNKHVLMNFFDISENIWSHKRIEFELKKVKEKSENAKKSISYRKFGHTNVLRTYNERNTNVIRTLYDTDTDTDIKKEKIKKEKKSGADAPVEQARPVVQVFEHWQKVMGHPKAKLSDKLKRKILQSLKSFDTVDLCAAIDGCRRTPWNQGQNPGNQVYDGLDLILRNDDQIRRFIHNSRIRNEKKIEKSALQVWEERMRELQADLRHFQDRALESSIISTQEKINQHLKNKPE